MVRGEYKILRSIPFKFEFEAQVRAHVYAFSLITTFKTDSGEYK